MNAGDLDWLLNIMAIPTVTPLEGGELDGFVIAQQAFLDGAEDRGWQQCGQHHPSLDLLLASEIPHQVRALATEEFLVAQPSQVVGLGAAQPEDRRIILNFHMDTVGPHVPPRLEGDTLHGRGAVDDKGPGVAALVGVTEAFRRAPWLAEWIEVRVASVSGEEGGAMGVYGTRWLVESGQVGRLMLFAEPTGNRVFDACSAAMTPRLSVLGDDSTDDHPTAGHNATVALGFLATRFAEELGPLAEKIGAKVCIAGLQSGTEHNRVYGTGELRLNLAYYDDRAAEVLAAEVERVVADARDDLVTLFRDNPVTRRLLTDWDDIVRLDWLKRGIPALANRDAAMEELLTVAGFSRHDAVADGSAFTCDAVWASGPGRYVAVCGPGDLATNRAHTPDEHVSLAELARYAEQIRELVLSFGQHVRNTELEGNA